MREYEIKIKEPIVREFTRWLHSLPPRPWCTCGGWSEREREREKEREILITTDDERRKVWVVGTSAGVGVVRKRNYTDCVRACALARPAHGCECVRGARIITKYRELIKHIVGARRLDNRYKLPPRAKQLTGETRLPPRPYSTWRPIRLAEVPVEFNSTAPPPPTAVFILLFRFRTGRYTGTYFTPRWLV